MTKRVYWRIGDREIEVEGDNAFIDKHLKTYFERLGQEPPRLPKDLPSKIVAVAKSGKVLSPAEYYRQKNPKGGTETLIVLGKYLDEFRNKSDFTRKDINALAHEAKIQEIHAQYYANAVKQGLLRSLGAGKYGLSISGEDAVAAMPSAKKD
ncbi:MAG TPA: hypothetical protein VMD77_00315 [Candidatus Baltobacteraceae bacterium]|nr:hypothetical protein [Candidatus Baltobacteraceae bacterium]